MNTTRQQGWVAFATGLLFAIGLGVGGMTQPAKVVGFLDFFGRWDPSLMFVMGGALSVHALVWRLVRHNPTPKLSTQWFVPTRRDLDRKLLGGAAIFGVGWGLGGYCPGPGITSIASGAVEAVVFVVAMLAGTRAVIAYERRDALRKAAELSAAETAVSPSPAPVKHH